MRKLLITGVSAILLSLGGFSPAQAQSLLDTLQGTGDNLLLTHMLQFEEGNWVNVAVNVGVVNAGVVAVGTPALYASATAAGAIDIGGVDPNDPLGSLVNIGLEGSAGISLAVLPGGQVHLKDVSTTAVGVVSEQHIASDLVFNDQSTKTFEASTSAAIANTDKTSAEAEWSSLDVNITKDIHIGPKQPIFAANLAFNVADVNAGAFITGSHIETGNISTLAAGVVSTQTISMGFDGSAFNSAVNGQ